MINRGDIVLVSLMFGAQRSQTGIIVVPRPPYEVDQTDAMQVSEFRNAIWYVPLPSRLFLATLLF